MIEIFKPEKCNTNKRKELAYNGASFLFFSDVSTP